MRVAIVLVNFGSHVLIDSNTGSLTDAEVVLVDNWKSVDDREAARALAVRRGWLLVGRPKTWASAVASMLGSALRRRQVTTRLCSSILTPVWNLRPSRRSPRHCVTTGWRWSLPPSSTRVGSPTTGATPSD